MIHYFSGTGNSRKVAAALAASLHDTLCPMTAAGPSGSTPGGRTGHIGFVFPVYGWGLPRVVERFIGLLPAWQEAGGCYVYAVLTCGDDIGRTDRLLRRSLARRGWPLHAVFSLQMRNTYVCLPGFDTDAPSVAQRKEQAAMDRLYTDLLPRIERGEASTPADIHPGSVPALKSYVLRPLFNALLTDERHFRTSRSACTRCGKCIKRCPLRNLRFGADGHVEWLGHCTHCLACYHTCPHHAISYGPFTKGKGQVDTAG